MTGERVVGVGEATPAMGDLFSVICFTLVGQASLGQWNRVSLPFAAANARHVILTFLLINAVFDAN